MWALTVDGVPVGSRSVQLTYREQGDAFVRMLESYTELSGADLDRKQRKLSYKQRLTANSEDHKPASFHSVLETNGVGREIQARYASGRWTLMMSGPEGMRTRELSGKRVDLSTVDLLDPESDRTLHGRDYARVLDAGTGEILEGEVREGGLTKIDIGGELMDAEKFIWDTRTGEWTFWYSTSGFLLRYHAPMVGMQVQGVLTGPAPRALDEFPVRYRPPTVEVEEL